MTTTTTPAPTTTATTTPPSAAEAADLLDRLAATAIVHRDSSGGTEIVWRQFGRGAPLVLVHGGHGSWMHWVRNIDALGASHTLWIPDMPGFGDSASLAGDPHAPDRLDRLVGTLARSAGHLLGTSSPFSLAGFSFGGLVSAHLAAAMPNVGKLALLGSGGHGGARRQPMQMVDWRLDDRAERLAALRHNLAALMLHDPANIDALAMAVHERSCTATRFRSRAISRGPLLAPAVAAYGGPTLLVWGEHDVTADPVVAGRDAAGDAPNCDWCLVPGGGHWVQYERPDDVNRLLLQWFADDR